MSFFAQVHYELKKGDDLRRSYQCLYQVGGVGLSLKGRSVSIIALASVGYSTVVCLINLYVPLGSSPEIRRSRPCQIGGSTDAEEAWSVYHSSAYLL